MKKFYVQNNIGKVKYVVSYHDGHKTHLDGSEFYDIAIFKNKKKLENFVSGLLSNGYTDTITQR